MSNSPWPTPITDRPPTVADADEYGKVQWFGIAGRSWSLCDWRQAVQFKDGWQHTQKWHEEQAALTDKDKALELIDRIQTGRKSWSLAELDVVRRALEPS